MTRDEARSAFKQSGLTYEDLTIKSLQELRSEINIKMKEGAYMSGSFSCKQRPVIRSDHPHGFMANIRCRSHYFDNREAVSFNPDGFIGFAGWADDTHIRPILDGFVSWIGKLKTKRAEKV